MKNYILEACVDSVESAIIASQAGANRLELCSNLIIGGTTPSIALFKEIRKHCDTKVHVLIRPRFGDFCYSEYEFNVIKEEVSLYKELGAEGVVIGLLKPDGTLDIERMQELLRRTQGMNVTLHRAFDVCKNPFQTLEQAKELGIHTILTSGQKSNCLEGKELIKELVQRSKDEMEILVAGGVCDTVIEEIRKSTCAYAYHMSGKIIRDSEMIYRKKDVNMGIASLSEFEIWQTSKEKIERAIQVLKRVE